MGSLFSSSGAAPVKPAPEVKVSDTQVLGTKVCDWLTTLELSLDNANPAKEGQFIQMTGTDPSTAAVLTAIHDYSRWEWTDPVITILLLRRRWLYPTILGTMIHNLRCLGAGEDVATNLVVLTNVTEVLGAVTSIDALRAAIAAMEIRTPVTYRALLTACRIFFAHHFRVPLKNTQPVPITIS